MSSIRILIKIFLVLQLLLLIFRQAIDFAGIQWVMILVNAIAIIVTITAFFGYLVLYATFQVFLIIYNIYVICVYARFITIGQEVASHIREYVNDDGIPIDVIHTSPLLPSAQLLSLDSHSRSFWYVIVSNHISNIQAHLSHHHQQPSSPAPATTTSVDHHIPPRHSTIDESLVDLCVQYIEIAIAALHVFFSFLAIGLILLKKKLERDKFLRNNDKTTPPLPPYTINPQMNHYMSFTPTIATTKSSLYSKNGSASSVRRSSKRRRSTRSLHSQKSKSNSMGALNIRANSSGSLRSISKQGHRKSATSLLMMNAADTSFTDNTIGSMRSGGKSVHSTTSNYAATTSNNMYGTIHKVHGMMKPSVPPRQTRTCQPAPPAYGHRYHPQPPPPPPSQRHSVYGVLPGQSSTSQQRVAKYLNSDSETDYYHTFTPPAYVNNGIGNPLYDKRNSYLDSSETAI